MDQESELVDVRDASFFLRESKKFIHYVINDADALNNKAHSCVYFDVTRSPLTLQICNLYQKYLQTMRSMINKMVEYKWFMKVSN